MPPSRTDIGSAAVDWRRGGVENTERRHGRRSQASCDAIEPGVVARSSPAVIAFSPSGPPTFGRFLPLALGSAESRSDLRVRPRIAPDSPPSFGQAGIRLQCHLARRRVTYVASAWRHTSCSGPIIDASEARRHLIEISESAGPLITDAWRRGRITSPRHGASTCSLPRSWRSGGARRTRLTPITCASERTAPSTCAATCSATCGADGCGSSGTRSPGYGQASPAASIRRAPRPVQRQPSPRAGTPFRRLSCLGDAMRRRP